MIALTMTSADLLENGRSLLPSPARCSGTRVDAGVFGTCRRISATMSSVTGQYAVWAVDRSAEAPGQPYGDELAPHPLLTERLGAVLEDPADQAAFTAQGGAVVEVLRWHPRGDSKSF